MSLEPWYKVATPRKEVREGRSFNPDEFAIHLEQVIGGTAPEDYRDPAQFFARTSFTRALREHSGMVLRRLAGETTNTSPVMTLVTQFGGGKTHTLTALYHLVTSGQKVNGLDGVADLLKDAGLPAAPQAKVAVFVGNAWDPREGCETPWIDLARQIAGDKGVEELGKDATNTPPGNRGLGPYLCRCGCAGPGAFRRSAEFRQSSPQARRALSRLYSEPDGGDDRHHARCSVDQPPAQPG